MKTIKIRNERVRKKQRVLYMIKINHTILDYI